MLALNSLVDIYGRFFMMQNLDMSFDYYRLYRIYILELGQFEALDKPK